MASIDILPDFPFRTKLTGTATGEVIDKDPEEEDINLLEIALACLPKSEEWATQHMYVKDNGTAIAQAIRNDTAVAVSDGSYDPEFQTGTSAFILIENINDLPQDTLDTKGRHPAFAENANRRPPNDSDNTIRGSNQVPGSPEHQGAYRSELAGILAVLIILQELCRIHDIQSGSITIGLDGQGAKEEAEDDDRLSATQPAFDMLLDIRARIKSLPIDCKFKWIKGHQETTGSATSTIGNDSMFMWTA